MLKRKQIYQAVIAALFLAAGASTPAFAVNMVNEAEREGTMGANDSILTAQRLTVDRDGKVRVTGFIGTPTLTSATMADLDFYSFDAKLGDTIDINIDFGIKRSDLTQRSVDTILAVFGPLPDVTWKRLNDNRDTVRVPSDPGSEDPRDAYIDKFVAPADGTYVVGVSSRPRIFVDGGGTTNTDIRQPTANGQYFLLISGVTPEEQLVHINIEIKPGSGAEAPLNPKARGNIPVALLSRLASDTAPAFDALKVDRSSLTFGSTGDEKSYLRCNKEGLDVNADGLLDLVCHFDNVAAGWKLEDDEGVLKGATMRDGKKIQGAGRLKVSPKQRD
jgi:Bacterial pre-peptidase C-terminal domain